MGEAAVKKEYFTIEDYLTTEEEAGYKSEYYNGEIVAMSGGSRNHSVICFNLNRRIGEAIDDKDCTGFDSNMKLRIAETDSFFYPDVMVVCGDIQFYEERKDIIINPVLIIEVLSPSTGSFDRGEKFEYYRSISSVKEYLLISQDKPMVEAYYKQDEKKWLYSVVKGVEESIDLQSIDCKLFLKDIYHKTEMSIKN